MTGAGRGRTALIDLVTEHLCGHRGCDQEKHRRRAAELLDAVLAAQADDASGQS